MNPTTLQHFQAPWIVPESYSAAIRCGDIIWTCGQLGVEPGAAPLDIATQVETALRRLVAVVEAAGGGVDTIIKINGYLSTMDDFPTYDRIYRRIIGVTPKPVRTMVQIGSFVPPILVEVDAVATVHAATSELPPGEKEIA